MGFIDSIGRTVAGSSQASKKKAGNTEEEKINAEIQKHQMNVLEEYQRIGEQYFKLFKDDRIYGVPAACSLFKKHFF